MLERIRESSQGIAAKVILGLVIASFALAGVGSYINMQGEIAAAEVNGNTISQREFDIAYQNERARMEAQFGEMFDQLVNVQDLRSGIIDRLISQELTDQVADDLGLRISDKQIKEAIFEMQEFQVDGKFDNERYLALLRNAGYQPATFREEMRKDMSRRQLLQALANSEFALDKEASFYKSLQDQKRDFSYVEVALEKFKQGIEVDESELQANYQTNIDSYQTEELVALSYIELKVDDLLAQVSVSDNDLQSAYESNKAAYTREERRRASHILIQMGDDEDAAKQKAEKLLAEIKAGADFAELAKANSDDTFSGEKGGDLDFFGKGKMTPEFEEAAYGLKELNDVSELVKTGFGFHIIKLTGVEAEAIQSFDEVKNKIAEQLKRDEANLLFGEKQQQVADLAYEVSDSLDDAAGAAGVEVKSTELVSRRSAPAPLSNRKVLNAIFSSDVLQDGNNSEVVEISADHIVVVRVTEHQAPRTKLLEEVKQQVNASVVATKAQKVAATWAQDTMAKWQAGDDISADLSTKGAEIKVVSEIGRYGGDLSSVVRTKAFEMAKPDADKSSYQWLEYTGNVALIKLDKVKADSSDIDDATKQRLQRAQSDVSYRAFVGALKESATIVTAASGS